MLTRNRKYRLALVVLPLVWITSCGGSSSDSSSSEEIPEFTESYYSFGSAFVETNVTVTACTAITESTYAGYSEEIQQTLTAGSCPDTRDSNGTQLTKRSFCQSSSTKVYHYYGETEDYASALQTSCTQFGGQFSSSP